MYPEEMENRSKGKMVIGANKAVVNLAPVRVVDYWTSEKISTVRKKHKWSRLVPR